MSLLIVFIVFLLLGQSVAVFLSLAVERMTTSYTGLVTFIVLYFLVFVVAWWLAVRVTDRRTSVES